MIEHEGDFAIYCTFVHWLRGKKKPGLGEPGFSLEDDYLTFVGKQPAPIDLAGPGHNRGFWLVFADDDLGGRTATVAEDVVGVTCVFDGALPVSCQDKLDVFEGDLFVFETAEE